MIYAFTGKTGSGKTFNMVKLARKRWLAGTDIYSNTILNFTTPINLLEKILHKLWHYITFQFVREPYRAKKRGRIVYFDDITEILEAKDGLILFDEAQVIFSSRQWESLPMEFQYKLQQHRKHRLDLFATTQNMGAIDISYRRLVQRWFHHKIIFDIGTNPVYLGLYWIEEKDVDMLYNSVDDLLVETIKRKLFIIHWLKKRYYDTFYDIGFKAFKTIWTSMIDKDGKLQSKAYIIPKQMSLNDAQKQISTLVSAYQPRKFRSYSRT